MKSLPYIGVVISLVCSLPIITIAAPVVRTIKQTQASGQTATLQTINVWNGHGVALSFYQVQETIKRVWLDDPSQILVDTDGCLEKLDQNCQTPGAGLIYLRRIKKVNIPGLPQSPTTLLTVITQTSTGDRKAYSFRVAVSSGSPKYSQVIITPDAVETKTATTPQLPSLVTNLETVNSIRNGIAISIRNKTLTPNNELHQRLKKLLTYLQQGDELTAASNKAVVSMELVNKLIEIGK